MKYSITDAFYAEQVFLLIITTLSSIACALQISAEKIQSYSIPSFAITFKFHRLALLLSLVLLVVCIDPFSIHNILNGGVIATLLANNIALYTTLLLLLCDTIILNYYNGYDADHHSSSQSNQQLSPLEQPRPWLWSYFYWCFLLFPFVLVNSLYPAAVVNNTFWYTGLFFAWLAFQLFVTLSCSLYYLYYSIDAIHYNPSALILTSDSYNSNNNSNSGEISKSYVISTLRKQAIAVFLLGGFIFIYSLAIAVDTLKHPSRSFNAVDLDEFDWNDRFLLYLEIAVLLFVMWYCWVPMNVYGYLYDRIFDEDRPRDVNQVSWRSTVADRLEDQPRSKLPTVKNIQAE